MSSEEFHLRATFSYRVYYEDTDFTGYVYHPNYLKFFDRAREDLIGIENLKKFYDNGRHFVVHKAELKFIHPASHSQTLLVESEGTFSRSPASPIIQRAIIQSPNPSQENILAVEAHIHLVTVNGQGQPVRMDDQILDALRARSHSV